MANMTLSAWVFLFVAVVLSCMTPRAQSAKILMMPISVNSHVVYFGQLAVGLAGESHQITLVLSSNSKVPDFVTETKAITVLKYKGENEQFSTSKEMSEILFRTAVLDGMLERLREEIVSTEKIFVHWENDAMGLINDTVLVERLQNSNFDFAILDSVYPPYFFPFAYKLGIPYAGFSIPYGGLIFRVPNLSSATPNYMSLSSDSMDFLARVKNFILDVAEYMLIVLMYDSNHDIMSKVVPEKERVPVTTLMQKSALWFYLYDPVLMYPRSMMPNTVYIADVMARPAKPLSSELEKTVSQATYGVIVVSFGSMMEGMPAKFSKIFFNVFGQLKQIVIMKKAGFIPDNVPDNVKLMKWIPQNDLLGHPNAKLFISHCGLNSIIEAVYHGKPVLGIPIAMDQPYNAFVVEDKGYGKALMFAKLTAEKLKGTIDELLSNTTYTDTANHLSQAFRDKPDTAAARASHMIHHVLQHGDNHLRTGAFNLNFFQFLMWDIYLFVLVVLIVVSAIVFCMCRSFCCCIFQRAFRRKSKEKIE